MLDRNTLEPKLYGNHLHHLNTIDELEYSGDRAHLTCEDVLDAHYLICNHFLKKGEGLGGFGPKDIGLLSSAISRQVASAFGSYVYDNLWDIASSLISGLINDHPFHDANKRTAFLSSVFLMRENNYVPRVDIVEVEDFTVEIAEYNHKHGHHMSIDEISPRFKTMFRKEDKRISYVVTFNELQGLLKQHDCSIGDPKHNLINVYRNENRVAQIGFPGWTKEVTRNGISTVRKSTGLTAENGYDAQVFFKDADPLDRLIGEYEEPLRRLAYR